MDGLFWFNLYLVSAYLLAVKKYLMDYIDKVLSLDKKGMFYVYFPWKVLWVKSYFWYLYKLERKATEAFYFCTLWRQMLLHHFFKYKDLTKICKKKFLSKNQSERERTA